MKFGDHPPRWRRPSRRPKPLARGSVTRGRPRDHSGCCGWRLPTGRVPRTCCRRPARDARCSRGRSAGGWAGRSGVRPVRRCPGGRGRRRRLRSRWPSRTNDNTLVFSLAVPTSVSPGYGVSTLGAVRQELVFASCDVGHPEPRHVVERGAEADRVGDVAGARLEAERRRVVDRPFERDVHDHVAPALVGRRLLEDRGLAVHDADTGRAEDLVPAEHEEVTVDRLHVDRDVRHRLRAVHDDRGAVPMRDGRHLVNRRDGAERVRHVRERRQLRPRREAVVRTRRG